MIEYGISFVDGRWVVLAKDSTAFVFSSIDLEDCMAQLAVITGGPVILKVLTAADTGAKHG